MIQLTGDTAVITSPETIGNIDLDGVISAGTVIKITTKHLKFFDADEKQIAQIDTDGLKLAEERNEGVATIGTESIVDKTQLIPSRDTMTFIADNVHIYTKTNLNLNLNNDITGRLSNTGTLDIEGEYLFEEE